MAKSSALSRLGQKIHNAQVSKNAVIQLLKDTTIGAQERAELEQEKEDYESELESLFSKREALLAK